MSHKRATRKPKVRTPKIPVYGWSDERVRKEFQTIGAGALTANPLTWHESSCEKATHRCRA